MEQAIQPANPEQIDVFLKAAEDQFAAMGLEPDVAAPIFSDYLAKQAEALGMQAPSVQVNEKQASVDPEAELVYRAAVERFVELGVPAEKAAAYLDAKIAESWQQPSEKVVKLAEHLKSVINK